MRLSSVFLLSFLLMAGCEKSSTSQQDERSQTSSGRYVPPGNDCALPPGAIFIDCVSDDWFPSYWRSPLHGEGGREVRTDEKTKHYVQVQVLPVEEAGGSKVLDVRYGYEPANASLRFKPARETTGFSDLSQFMAGSLQFDIRALDWGFASGLSVNVECGWPCTSDPINIPLAPLGEWRTVEISADKFVGLDLSRVDSGINITPTWNSAQGIRYQMDNIRWVTEPAAQPLQIENRNWSALALRDLDFIYQTTLENHPGAIDEHNPDFRKYLDGGYEEAIASLHNVETMRDYADLMLNYMAGFNDGHFKLILHRLPMHVQQSHLEDRPLRNIPDYTRIASIQQLEEDVYWVYLPSFLELDAVQRAAIHNVIKRLRQLPESSKVVFDVRWNDGGNSMWGWRILEGLYSKSFVRRLYIREGGAEHTAEFRVSDGNAKYYQLKAASLGPEDPIYDLIINLSKDLQRAFLEGRDWHDPGSRTTLERLASFWHRFGSLDSSITPVLVTSEGCASACLDFADLVVRLPNARHLGLETGSDTRYLDIRLPPPQLPSGLGELVIPMKVWRKRFRDHNEAYIPDLIYPGDIYDTKAVQQWVLTKVLAP